MLLKIVVLNADNGFYSTVHTCFARVMICTCANKLEPANARPNTQRVRNETPISLRYFFCVIT
jgi:hypothetical protein